MYRVRKRALGRKIFYDVYRREVFCGTIQYTPRKGYFIRNTIDEAFEKYHGPKALYLMKYNAKARADLREYREKQRTADVVASAVHE